MARRSTKNRPVAFHPPFRSSGYFVLDSLGMVFCQFVPTEFIRVNCEAHETAKWVVDALNGHAANGACGIAEAAMRHFKIYTRAWGNHDVDADTKREAVAKLVARLGLKECECAGVGNWAISERQVRE